MNFHSATFERVLNRLNSRGSMPDIQVLDIALRILAKWRSTLLANTVIAHGGLTVQSGPFVGMEYVRHATEGALAARLLGIYERELHPHIEALRDVEHIIDVGCAEGYYAVGFARRFPEAKVHAFDISPEAREACRSLADKNGVAIDIQGEFAAETLDQYASASTLLFCDIEGGEDLLLDPARHHALRKVRLMVETHPGAAPGVTERLTERFSSSHYIQRLEHRPNLANLPAWANSFSHLDILLLAWEWRGTATPWLVMTPRDG